MKFYGGKSQNRKRSLTAIIAIALIICVAVGGTIAFIVTKTNDVTNTFNPADVSIKIAEKFDENTGVKSEIKVLNVDDAKNVPCYIRIKLVSNMQDSSGNVTGGAAIPSFALNEQDWINGGDGYYYYRNVVAVGAYTSDLIADGSQMQLANGQVVEVLAEGIQATPKDAVIAAWGAAVAEKLN